MKLHLKQPAALALVVLLLGVMGVAADDKEVTASTAPTVQEQLQQQQVRIAELERLLKKQAELLERLQEQVAAKGAEPQPGPNSASTAAPAVQGISNTQEVDRISSELDAVAENQRALNDKVNQVDKKIADSEKTMSGKLKGLGNFNFSGDVRLRFEPFFGGTQSTNRYRERFRLRFNVLSKFSDELTGGFSVASGDANDPISTNQTITSFLQRKEFRLDRAFLAYNPNWAKPLTLTGGKFGYTWYRTELTNDSDTNPEGFSQALAFNIDTSVLKKISIVGFELPFNEVGSGPDSAVYGAQIGSHWKLGDRAKFSGYLTYYNWHNADALRVAQVAGKLGGSTNTNAASATQFASAFGLFDIIGRLDIDTGYTRWPLMLQLDFVNNTRACGNTHVTSVIPCNPKDRSGYWAEVGIGQTKEKGDVAFGYTFMRIEQEAVQANYNFSDLRQPTNDVNHRITFAYQAYKNITLGYTLLVGKALRTALNPADEPWLKRMQFDVIYKF
jgi:hypothetical protein